MSKCFCFSIKNIDYSLVTVVPTFKQLTVFAGDLES